MLHHPNHMESRLANDLVKPPPCLESPLTRLMLPSGLIMIMRMRWGSWSWSWGLRWGWWSWSWRLRWGWWSWLWWWWRSCLRWEGLETARCAVQTMGSLLSSSAIPSLCTASRFLGFSSESMMIINLSSISGIIARPWEKRYKHHIHHHDISHHRHHQRHHNHFDCQAGKVWEKLAWESSAVSTLQPGSPIFWNLSSQVPHWPSNIYNVYHMLDCQINKMVLFPTQLEIFFRRSKL